MIVRISGGIGNQMFQYAFKKKLDVLHEDKNYLDIRFFDNKTVHNGYELKRVFGITDEIYEGKIHAPSETNPILYRVLYKIKKRMFKTSRYIMEVLIDYYDKYNQLKGEDFYFDGYWQSEDYFADISDKIVDSFIFPVFSEDKNLLLQEEIIKKNSVAIHVRRGDYLNNSKFVCLGKTDYYKKAVDYINSMVPNPYFVILSDDIEWCKQHLNNIEDNSVFVDWNKGDKSYRDMQIISMCKHCIIANSSFSWWGAWLIQNKDKIIVAPKKFYRGNIRNEDHLVPDVWVKIDYSETA